MAKKKLVSVVELKKDLLPHVDLTHFDAELNNLHSLTQIADQISYALKAYLDDKRKHYTAKELVSKVTRLRDKIQNLENALDDMQEDLHVAIAYSAVNDPHYSHLHKVALNFPKTLHEYKTLLDISLCTKNWGSIPKTKKKAAEGLIESLLAIWVLLLEFQPATIYVNENEKEKSSPFIEFVYNCFQHIGEKSRTKDAIKKLCSNVKSQLESQSRFEFFQK